LVGFCVSIGIICPFLPRLDVVREFVRHVHCNQSASCLG
jgi:hypothetical protein